MRFTPGVIARRAIAVAVLLLLAGTAAADERSTTTTDRFRRLNACPATGQIQKRCPGWVIDHIVPLCLGGADSLDNLTWQPKAEAAKKDRLEIALCAMVRKLRKQKEKQP